MLHYIGFDDRYKMRLVFYAAANQGIRVVDFRDPRHPKEIAYYKRGTSATTRPGRTDFTRPDPARRRYCLNYTGWNQGGLRELELTNPEYNPACAGKRAAAVSSAASGKKAKVHFSLEARAAAERRSWAASLEPTTAAMPPRFASAN